MPEPRFTPVTVGCVAAGVAPALIVTLADEIVTFVGVAACQVHRHSTAAGVGRVMAKVAVAPEPQRCVGWQSNHSG